MVQVLTNEQKYNKNSCKVVSIWCWIKTKKHEIIQQKQPYFSIQRSQYFPCRHIFVRQKIRHRHNANFLLHLLVDMNICSFHNHYTTVLG